LPNHGAAIVEEQPVRASYAIAVEADDFVREGGIIGCAQGIAFDRAVLAADAGRQVEVAVVEGDIERKELRIPFKAGDGKGETVVVIADVHLGNPRHARCQGHDGQDRLVEEFDAMDGVVAAFRQQLLARDHGEVGRLLKIEPDDTAHQADHDDNEQARDRELGAHRLRSLRRRLRHHRPPLAAAPRSRGGSRLSRPLSQALYT